MRNQRTTREAESRASELRVPARMGFISPLDLPPGVARPGFRYFYAALEARGIPVYDVETMIRDGWELVPVDRAPQYSLDPLNRTPLASKYFVYKDVILLEKSEELCARKDNYNHQINMEKVMGINGLDTGGAPLFALPNREAPRY